MNKDEVIKYVQEHPWAYDSIFDEIVYGQVSLTVPHGEIEFKDSKGMVSFMNFSELRKLIKNNMLFKSKREAQPFRKKVKGLRK